MASIKRNLAANYLGNIWAGLMGIIFIPVYVFYVGAEGYGVVGFYIAFVGMLTIFDMGIGTTTTRELARLESSPAEKQRAANLVRTYEMFFWGVGLLSTILITLTALWLTDGWLKPQDLSANTVTTALRLLAWAILGQFVLTFYNSCLLGLQCHQMLNLFNAFFVTVRWGGSALILWLIAPSLELFALWQALIMLLHAVTLRYWVWKKLAPVDKPKPLWSNISHTNGFIYRVWGINMLNMMLTSGDKLFLSYILTLKQFGYYTLAWSLACIVYRIIMPFYNTIYPRFCQLIALGERDKLTELYRLASQFFAIALVPFCLTLAFFSYEVLLLWTRDQELAKTLHWVLSILMIAMLFRGFQTLTYAAQLAYGWTKQIFIFYAISVLMMFPALLLFNHYWGLIGVASFCLIIEVCYIIIVIPLFYRRYLNELKWWWYGRVVLQPVVFTIVVVLAGKWYVNEISNVWGQIGGLLGSYVLSMIVVPMLLRDIRNYLREQLHRVSNV